LYCNNTETKQTRDMTLNSGWEGWTRR